MRVHQRQIREVGMRESAKKLIRSSPALRGVFAGILTLAVCSSFVKGQSAPLSPSDVAQLATRVRSSALDAETLSNALALSQVLIRERRFAEAWELFGAVLARNPAHPFALYGAALSAFNLGKNEEAERLARAAVAATTTDAGNETAFGVNERTRAADALVLLAIVLSTRGEDTEALKAAQRSVQIAEDHFDAQFTLGRAYYSVGDIPAASAAFRAAVALNPADRRALFFLGTTLERIGDIDGALQTYRHLVAKHPQSPQGHLGLGTVLVRRGGSQTEEGIKELKIALALEPDLYEARVALGRTLVARGRAAESIEHLVRAAELAPDNPEPQYQLSLAYRRLGRSDKAAEASAAVKRIHETRRASSTAPKTEAVPRR